MDNLVTTEISETLGERVKRMLHVFAQSHCTEIVIRGGIAYDCTEAAIAVDLHGEKFLFTAEQGLLAAEIAEMIIADHCCLDDDCPFIRIRQLARALRDASAKAEEAFLEQRVLH